MKLITDSRDPRFREISRIWGPAAKSEDKMERDAVIVVAWLMQSLRSALSRAEKAERELEDEKQKVANLEEYMLKGVAFRDELQARLCVVTDALTLIEHATDPNSFDDGGGHENAYDIAHEALAGPPRICRHAEEVEYFKREQVAWNKFTEDANRTVDAAEAEVEMYKRLLQEQADATNVVLKELCSCYSELGIYRHPDEPDRGPEAIKSLREALEKAACGPRLDPSKCSGCNGTGIRNCICGGKGTVEGERDGYKVAALERILRADAGREG